MAITRTTSNMISDVGTGANQLVRLDNDAKLPAIDGSNLLNVSGSGGGGGSGNAASHHFSVKLSADQDITTSGFEKILWNTELIDASSAFDSTTNNRFVAPDSGLYMIGFNVCFHNAHYDTVRIETALYKNGTILHKVMAQNLGQTVSNVGASEFIHHTATFSNIINLNAGDYLEVFIEAHDASTSAAEPHVVGGNNAHASVFYGYKFGGANDLPASGTMTDLTITSDLTVNDDIICNDNITIKDGAIFESENGSGENAIIQKHSASGRDELMIRAANDAYQANSRGAGINLYGNADAEHAGNFVVMTGQNNDGDARMIISGGSSLPNSDGYRTNTDTRVTIGNDIWDFVDNANDTALLTLENPINRPALYINDAATDEGDIAVATGQYLSLGHWSGSTFTQRVWMDDVGNWNPANTNIGLGKSSNRWDDVWAVDGSINTSDDRLKTYLNIEDAERGAALEIKKNLKKFKWNKSIEEKGDDARIHFGASAQTIGQIMEKYGLDPTKYGFYCYDEWEDVLDPVSGAVITPAGNTYSVRYSELFAFILSAI